MIRSVPVPPSIATATFHGSTEVANGVTVITSARSPALNVKLSTPLKEMGTPPLSVIVPAFWPLPVNVNASASPASAKSVTLPPPLALMIFTNSKLLNVTGCRPAAVIWLPTMVTARPSAMKFSVSLPSSASTVIGVAAEGVIVNVSSSSAAASTPIEASGAISVPATITLAPVVSAASSPKLAVMIIPVLAWTVEPDESVMLSPARSVTDELVDEMVAPEFTVRSSPAMDVSDAVRTMAPAAVMSESIVRGLPELIVTAAMASVALIGPLTVMPSPATVLP